MAEEKQSETYEQEREKIEKKYDKISLPFLGIASIAAVVGAISLVVRPHELPRKGEIPKHLNTQVMQKYTRANKSIEDLENLKRYFIKGVPYQPEHIKKDLGKALRGDEVKALDSAIAKTEADIGKIKQLPDFKAYKQWRQKKESKAEYLFGLSKIAAIGAFTSLFTCFFCGGLKGRKLRKLKRQANQGAN